MSAATGQATFASIVASDPAVVSARPTKPKGHHNKNDTKDDHHYLPKVEKPKSSALRVKPAASKQQQAAAAEGEQEEQKPAVASDEPLSFPDVDFTTHVLVKTTADSEYVSLPRASASNIPGLKFPAATEDKSTPVVVEMANLHSGALIAINEWIEKKGVTGVSTTAFANPITYTELSQVVADEWEKEFSNGLLRTGEAIIGCINFSEKNGLKGLQQFAIVALSCALRGATAHEMASAMGHSENDSFTESEVTAGRAAFPEAVALTNKRQ